MADNGYANAKPLVISGETMWKDMAKVKSVCERCKISKPYIQPPTM
ncbi:hypothetical protein ACVD60_21325 [Escherichia coli]